MDKISKNSQWDRPLLFYIIICLLFLNIITVQLKFSKNLC